MSLSQTHLRYLLTVYELSLTTPDVSSAQVAAKLGVKKSSVSAMLTALMKEKLLVKKRYGKIYLTDTGCICSKELEKRISLICSRLPRLGLGLDSRQARCAACAIASVLPEGSCAADEPSAGREACE